MNKTKLFTLKTINTRKPVQFNFDNIYLYIYTQLVDDTTYLQIANMEHEKQLKVLDFLNEPMAEHRTVKLRTQ